jgi:hypothetical protein
MSNQQAYEAAIALGQVQAAKVFKKRMNAEVAELESICKSMAIATEQDYASLDALCESTLVATEADYANLELMCVGLC